jgi:hypothetical protein
MSWLYLNNCSGEVIAVDEGAVVLKASEAPSFGAPTEETPLRLGVFREEELVDVVVVTGRAGTTLTLAEGSASVGDTLASVPLAEDRIDVQTALAGKQPALPAGGAGEFLASDLTWQVPPSADLSGLYTKTEVDAALSAKQDTLPASGDPTKYLNGSLEWAAIPAPDLSAYPTRSEVDTALAAKASTITTAALDGRVAEAESDIADLQTGKADVSDLSEYATTTALSNGLATKENTLPSGGTSGQFLRHDKTWGAPQKGLIHVGRWSTPTDSAASTGEMDARLIASPMAAVPAYVLLSAVANATGASVQVSVGGVDLFASPVTLAGGTTNPMIVSSFALGSIAAGSPVKPSITAIGGDVRGLVVDVWAREV